MSQRILLLDDSRVARLAVRRIVSETFPDYTLLDTSDIAEFEALAAEQPYALALVDYNMPSEDGLQVVSRLLAARPQARIALLTANIQASIQNKAAALGIGFLPKPLRADALATVLRGVEG